MKISKETIKVNDSLLTLRAPETEDAQILLNFLKKVSGETPYLIRTEEEVNIPLEKEISFINRINSSDTDFMILAFLDDKFIGNCSMTAHPFNRQKHRADMGIALLQKYTDLGIGTIMMDRLVNNAINNGIEKLELDVFSQNEKAIHLYNKYSFKEYNRIPNYSKYKDNTYDDLIYMVKDLKQTISVNNNDYHIIRLLGKGKGGYSYLALKDNQKYVLKQIHHEPCDYYSFSNKIESEYNDYQRLINTGLLMPRMIDIDFENERIIKEYIEGPSISTLVKKKLMKDVYYSQINETADILKKHNLNIDYYPTNFIVLNDLLYYIDYECNTYMEEYSYQVWGRQYWH
ncbi:MAG: GNAT family N-acetyltransferase [Erysipelotrichaceae bacterium]